jgi:hypothetical protein
MSELRITIHSTGSGLCALTGKNEADGLTVTFEDGTVQQTFLSWKGFRQILSLKAKNDHAPAPNNKIKVPEAKPVQA